MERAVLVPNMLEFPMAREGAGDRRWSKSASRGTRRRWLQGHADGGGRGTGNQVRARGGEEREKKRHVPPVAPIRRKATTVVRLYFSSEEEAHSVSTGFRGCELGKSRGAFTQAEEVGGIGLSSRLRIKGLSKRWKLATNSRFADSEPNSTHPNAV
jgi:hypothetical protein